MDYFLRASDYSKLIQSDKLDVVISEDESIKLDAELAALEEVKSYLRHRYKEDLVFAPLQSYDDATTYYWGDRIYLTADAFSPVTVYTTGQKVLQAGNVYQNIAGSAAKSFNESEWDLLGSEGHYQMEVELWDDEANYVLNDLVKYETKAVRKYYRSLSTNTNIDPYNDNGDNWEVVTSISGEIPTSAYWIAGDSRNKLIVMHLIDIVLYHLHSRINPRNIPEFRIQRRDDAISYLKMIAKGQVSIDLDLITPEQGNNISYGSQPVNNNFY
jgi:hypothetical protein